MKGGANGKGGRRRERNASPDGRFLGDDRHHRFPPLRMIMAPDDYDDLWCKPDTVQRTHLLPGPAL